MTVRSESVPVTAFLILMPSPAQPYNFYVFAGRAVAQVVSYRPVTVQAWLLS
jgi:hypothetical protein